MNQKKISHLYKGQAYTDVPSYMSLQYTYSHTAATGQEGVLLVLNVLSVRGREPVNHKARQANSKKESLFEALLVFRSLTTFKVLFRCFG